MRLKKLLDTLTEDTAATVEHPRPGIITAERGGVKVQITHARGHFVEAIELGEDAEHVGLYHRVAHVAKRLGLDP